MKGKNKNEFCQNIFKMKKKREDFEKKVIGKILFNLQRPLF